MHSVTRITAESEALNVNITLDLANELIQFKPKEKFSLALARSLHPELEAEAARGGVDKANEVKREMWRGGEQGLAEEYDYVMHGKVRLNCLTLEIWMVIAENPKKKKQQIDPSFPCSLGLQIR